MEHFARDKPLARIGEPTDALSDLMHERTENRLQWKIGPARVHRRRPDHHATGSDAALHHRRRAVVEPGNHSRIAGSLECAIAEHTRRREVAASRRAEDVEDRTGVID